MGCCQKKKKNVLLEQKVESDELLEPSSESLKTLPDPNIKVKVKYEDFEPLKLLGKGSFGEVILVRFKADKKVYVVDNGFVNLDYINPILLYHIVAACAMTLPFMTTCR